MEKECRMPVVDILEPRRKESDIKWAARPWHPVSAFNQPRKASSWSIKATVLSSSRLKSVIDHLSGDERIPVDELYRRVAEILEEVGYNREMPVLRLLGLFTSKLLKKLCSAVYVNEDQVLKIKHAMGQNPVLFVPTHRSYGDFILMSYICFHYELDIPRIAAGMDFQGMTFMGEVLRDSCAFFMRRSFAHDKLYSAAFSEYVQTLVTHGDGPIEFFIEGTRSRSGKSLVPKFGFLTMALRPFLIGQVADISIVPVNISYERVMEENLFAYELLGIPKPKESTKGFIKALRFLKENYGKVYVNFGEPFSVAEVLGARVDRTLHSYGPLVVQDITPNESAHIVELAHCIVDRQRQLTTLTVFNVISAVLNCHFLLMCNSCSLSHLVDEVKWLIDVLTVLNARVDLSESCLRAEIQARISLHKNFLCICGEDVRLKFVQLQPPPSAISSLRGCNLNPAAMEIAVPYMMLQHYVNPCSHYFVPISFLVYCLKGAQSSQLDEKSLLARFAWFYRLLSYEFVLSPTNLQKTFDFAIHSGLFLEILSREKHNILLGSNHKLITFCLNFLAPFLPAYFTLAHTVVSVHDFIDEQQLLKLTQANLQNQILDNTQCHPANLSLDTINNAVHSLCSTNVIQKTKRNGINVYYACSERLDLLINKLANYVSLIRCGNIKLLVAKL